MTFFKKLWFAARQCFRDETLFPDQFFPDIDTQVCARQYIDNMELARRRCRQMGARYYNYLQPYNENQRQSVSKFDIASMAHIRRRKTRSGASEEELVARFYEAVKQQMETASYFESLEDAFWDTRGNIYLDHVHTSDRGYDRLADLIAQDIAAKEARP